MRFYAKATLFQRDSEGIEHPGPSQRFEVEAESASEARSRIEAAAKSQWRPSTRGRIDVGPVQPVERAPQNWYAFVFEDEYGHLEQSATGSLGASFVVRGMLYVFDSRELRREFIEERVTLGEHAKDVSAKRLPKGWDPDHAMHLELSESGKHWMGVPVSSTYDAKPDRLPRDKRWE